MSSAKWRQIILASVCQLNSGDVSSVISPSPRRDWLNLWPTYEHPCDHGGLIMAKWFYQCDGISKNTFFYIYYNFKTYKKAGHNETHRSSWLYSPRVSRICFPPWASTFVRSQQIQWTPSDLSTDCHIYTCHLASIRVHITEACNTFENSISRTHSVDSVIRQPVMYLLRCLTQCHPLSDSSIGTLLLDDMTFVRRVNCDIHCLLS